MHKLIYIICFCFFSLAQAQVEFTAKASREKLGINERLKLEFKMNKNGDNFVAPDFRGFNKVAGPYQSVSQSWINGKSTFQKTITIFLQPQKRGKFTIGQAQITVDGQTYKTSPIAVEVTAAVDKPSLDGEATPETKALQGIHLVAEVSDKTPYINEGIYVVYKLYISPSTNISNWRDIDNPTYKNFWSQNIDIKKLELKNGEFAGRPYQYIELRKTVLYPQKTGKLTIEPLTLSIAVEVPTNKRDFFGRRYYETVDKIYSAKTQTINVQPLPNKDIPASFTGAVGKFDFDFTIDKSTTKAMESIQAEVKLTGKGNLSLFDLPKLETPVHTEIFEPEKQDNIRTTAQGMVGSKKNIYTLVPQQAGKQIIPSMEFSYFDPNLKKYITKTSKSLTIEVEPNASIVNSNRSLSSSADNTFVINTPKNQFSFIQLDTTLKSSNQKMFFKTNSFWMAVFSVIALFPLFLIVHKFKNKKDVQENDKRLKKANKLARKYLSESKKHIHDSNAFFLSLEKALHNYLKAKLGITTSELSKEKIKEVLTQKGAHNKDVLDFINLLQNCEMARYSPVTKTEINKDYQQAVNTIAQLDKNI